MNKIERIGYTSTVTSRGQTTIPKPLRDTLNIREGTELFWVVRDGYATIEARSGRLIDLAGILGNPLGRTVSIKEMKDAVLDEAAERHGRKR